MTKKAKQMKKEYNWPKQIKILFNAKKRVQEKAKQNKAAEIFKKNIYKII